MVLGDTSYMNYMYSNPIYLNYLRYHPKWYKILYYDPTKMKDFINEAQKSMNLTTKDRLTKLNSQLSFISGIASMLK
ncbi:MAG: YlbE-like family protein [bacterium]